LAKAMQGNTIAKYIKYFKINLGIINEKSGGERQIHHKNNAGILPLLA
jgi:hypothetical protein